MQRTITVAQHSGSTVFPVPENSRLRMQLRWPFFRKINHNESNFVMPLDMSLLPYRSRISAAADLPPYQGVPSPYIILGTERSGTTVIAEGLYSTGQAGCPHEYEGPGQKKLLMERWNVFTSEDYLAHLFRYRTTPNGIWGIKILAHTIDQAATLYLLEQYRPVYIYIFRKNKIEQAVSRFKAKYTDAWTESLHRSRKKIFNKDYSFQKILECFKFCLDSEQTILTFISNKKAMINKFMYEDMRNDIVGHVCHVCNNILNIYIKRDNIDISHMVIQKNTLSEYFIERFIKDFFRFQFDVDSHVNQALCAIIKEFYA